MKKVESVLENKFIRLVINPEGGAISKIHFKHVETRNINPLNFVRDREDAIEDSRNNFPFRGHFLCLGRWGPSSLNERNLGNPSHGYFSNMNWELENSKRNEFLAFSVSSLFEGLNLKRRIILERDSCIIGIKDKIKNIATIGRVFNIVQHPTIGFPFLDKDLIVDCNGDIGFDQRLGKDFKIKKQAWPIVNLDKNLKLDLRSPDIEYNSVFTFRVGRKERYGKIWAFNPRYKLLLGYIWRRDSYPWIHLWQDWKDHTLIFRGLEFGTAGIHRPPGDILNFRNKVFGEKVIDFIDAGEIIEKRFLFFLTRIEDSVKEMNGISVSVDNLGIKISVNNKNHLLSMDLLKDFI